MESQDNNSISEISNKDNYYKFDNYGNVMADSIEDLLYDKYTTKNNYREDYDTKNKELKDKFYHGVEKSNNSNNISLSSSVPEEEEEEEKEEEKQEIEEEEEEEKEKDEEIKKEKKKKNKEIKKEKKREIKKEKKKEKKNKKDKKMSISKNINIQYKSEKTKNTIKKNIIIKSNNSSEDILDLMNNEEKVSGTDDKFLESKIHEDKNEKKENISNSTEEDKFMNTLEGNDICPQNIHNYNEVKNHKYNYNNNDDKDIKLFVMNDNENKIIHHRNNNKEDLSKDIISINSNFNIKNFQNFKSNSNINSNSNSDEVNNESISKKNSKEYKNMIHNKNIEEKTESTKVNSKKSNALNSFNPDKNFSNFRNIKKIHLNSPSKTINKKIKTKKNDRKIFTNQEGNKTKKNYIIKLNLNELKDKLPIPKICYITKFRKKIFCNEIIPKKPRLFITKTYNTKINYTRGPLLSVVNDCYFCTKEINYINMSNIQNDNKIKIIKKINKYNDESNNNSDLNHNSDYDEQYQNEDEYKKDKKNKNKKSKNQKPEMYTELDLDKYHNPQNIRIKINNPFYPLYKFANQGNQTIHLNRIHRNKNRFLDKNIFIKKDSDKNTIIINNRKKLGPLKIKRKTKTNSTNSLYTTKSDHMAIGNDYNYFFNNKEIAQAIGQRNGRICEACISLKKKQENEKNIVNNNRVKIKSLEPESRKNNYFKNYFKIENHNRRLKNTGVDDKGYYHSYSRNKNKKKKLINRQNNDSISSISSSYANVINIDFPVLNSYFH